ncbi:hypothetical protein [Azohydromonas sp.]|uniref:hypothetical protein n=1 Tax=Azohydromonas sp. TaxID=1872666 RepID=UPI002C1B63F1|nr:hypothetical protein [Azohydromonas sp.]HMM85341.1 hypothetical protein [Azohydromonas sp.]
MLDRTDLFADLFTDRRLTQPWRADEYLVVDGLCLVYTARRGSDDVTVHLPGCRSVSLRALRDAGHDVTLPTRWRIGP